MSANTDIWVTGLGAHTAAGAGIAALQRALVASNVLAAPSALAHGRWVARAPEPALGHVGKRISRSAGFYVAAAREAWESSGLDRLAIDPTRLAVIEGSSLGPMGDLLAAERERAEEGYPARVHPAQVFRMMLGAGSAVFAQEVGAEGAVFALSAGSTSGAMAVIEGCTKLRAGLADVVVVGGSDAPIDPEVIATFHSAGILAPISDALPCRPFGADRCGTMLGEGAAVVVLERAEHAKRRGAVPLAILNGVGVSGEVGSRTAPDAEGRGVRRAAVAALQGFPLEQIGWIKAHGTATQLNDAAEVHGLSGIAEWAPFCSLKPQLGHTLGASGAIELAAAILALQRGYVPATLGTQKIDPALRERRVVMQQEANVRMGALLLSQSLGGRCAALVVSRA